MPLNIVRNDITKVKADAIVNSANRKPICGGGTAFALDAKYIIHTVGPKWNDGKSGEIAALANCYRNALEKAKELGCESIAFPLISSGVFRFPKDYAVRIATQAIGDFLQTNEMLVTLVVFDRKAFEVSEDLYSDIQAFVDDNYVQEKDGDVRRFVKWRRQGRNIPDEERYYALEEPRGDIPLEECSDEFIENRLSIADGQAKKHAEKCSASLDDILAKPGETFCDKLFNLIHEKNLDDVEVYKKANLDRKHFSKIRSNVKYKPTKKTVLALAIALHLNMDETKDLLARAELALSPSNRGDLVVSYFIERGKYDIWEINNMLFKFGLPTLGI